MDPNNPNTNTPVPQQPSPLSTDIPQEEGGGIFKKKLLSIIIGLIVLSLIVGGVFFYVIPRIFPSKPGTADLVYWGLWEDPNVMEQIISDFNREYPDIKVKYEKQDIKGLGRYVERLNTRINNGKGPDVFRFHSSWPLQLKGNLLAFPKDVVDSLEVETAYFSPVKKDLKVNGAYYGVPIGIDVLSLFVNEDLFKAADIKDPPTNWNDLTDMAAALTVPDESGNIRTAGVALGTFDNINHASDIISLLFIQNGADLYDLDGTTKQNAVDALGVYYTYFAKGDDNGRGKTWDADMEDSLLAFANGRLAMYFGYSWDVFEIKAKNPDLNFKIVSVPHLPPDRDQTIASYWAEGVSAKTRHPKEAFAFLKFLAKKENLEKLYAAESKQRLFGEPYPRRDMKDLLKDNVYLYPMLSQADKAVSTPFSSNTYDGGLNEALNTYLGNAVNSILNGTSAESAIETLGAGEESVLSKYGIVSASQK
jgi:multiple sugar transport system substrate-binding protein